MKKLVPLNFKPPEVLKTDEFRLRMLTVNDVVKDYDAEVYIWVRKSEYDKGLDSILFKTIKQWIKKNGLSKRWHIQGEI